MSVRLRQALQDDSGIAMLVVIGVMSVVTILAVSSFVFARQSLHESVRVEDASRAFRAASTGLEERISTLSEDDIEGFPEAGILGSTPDGTYVLTLERLGGTEFEIVSVGTGLDNSTQTVRQRFFFLNLWRMNISAGSDDSLITGGNALAGNSHITGPFYTRGQFSIGQGMTVSEGPLFVKSGPVDEGITQKGGVYHLGHPGGGQIDVFCEGGVPDFDYAASASANVNVRNRSVSVPDIMLPPLTQDNLDLWAGFALEQSVDNLMGSTGQSNVEVADPAHPETYLTAFTRATPTTEGVVDTDPHYKFFGTGGKVSDKGTGSTTLKIGDKTFGAWGRLVDVHGHQITSGMTGYPEGRHDDFAYDSASGILFISGTVFVDGPVNFVTNTKYVGNGTIIANGPITISGYLRPYHIDGQSHIERGEDNKWALGLVTSEDLVLAGSGSNPGAPGASNPRDTVAPLATYAGAFYAGGKTMFTTTNQIFVGSLLTGEMDFGSGGGAPNKYIVTNPNLPSYLPESLPGGDLGMLLPTHWSRD